MADQIFDIKPEDSRLTTYPIHRHDIWMYVKDAQRSFWTCEEIATDEDKSHFKNKLDAGAQRCVKYILGFFAASDGVVNMNLAKRFREDVPMLEVTYFYDFQIMIEDIHAEMYSLMLDTIIEDAKERQTLLNAITTMSIISRMTAWMFDCMQSTKSFAYRLLAMACVEGIFFSSCFCIIYWLNGKGLMPGLGQSNILIARDEGLHTSFALYLYTLIKPEYQLSTEEIHKIFESAVDIAIDFAKDMMPNALIEMNHVLMTEYIKFVANNLLAMLNVRKLYTVNACPFAFMEKINMEIKANFFERRSANYSKPKQSSGDSEIDMKF